MSSFGGENMSAYKQTSDTDDCLYNISDISVLKEETWTPQLELSWPCELREYWQGMLSLHNAASYLLNYGTSVIICAGLLFNLLIIRTLCTRMKTPATTVMYLVALAVYDSCVLLFNFAVGVLRAQNPHTINELFKEQEWLCVTHSVLVELFNLLSVWMIVCFTIERFIAVYFPLRVSELCSPKRTKLIIVMVTAAIFIFSLYKIAISGFEGDSVFGYKACKTSRMKSVHTTYVTVTLSTWLPALLLAVLNVIIIRAVRKSAMAQRKMSWRSQRMSRSTRREFRITRTLLVTSATYLMLLLPLGTVQITELWMKSGREVTPSADRVKQMEYIRITQTFMLLKWIRMLCFFFYQFNFAINFFVYLVTNAKFRRALFDGLPCELVARRWLQESSVSSFIGKPQATGSRNHSTTDVSVSSIKCISTVTK